MNIKFIIKDICCWLLGHKVMSPRKWEFGWWSARDQSTQSFNDIECVRCKKAIKFDPLETYRWSNV